MIRYIIVEAATPHSLQAQVNSSAEQGYIPVGGVAVVPESKRLDQSFIQAMMVKEEE